MCINGEVNKALMAWCKEEFSERAMAPSYQYFIDLVVGEFQLKTLSDVERAIKVGDLGKGINLYYERMTKIASKTKRAVRIEE